MSKPTSIVSTLDMPREEWLDWRRQGIGGSDAPAILGLNPYSSALAVYLDKLGLAPEREETEAMWLGTKLEPIAAERFEEQTGKKVMRRNFLFQHPDHPWMLANIDRWVVGEDCGLEIKTTNMLNRTPFDKGEIPASYYVQCMHYMAVMGVSRWYLAVMVLNKDFHVFTVERDEEEISALIAAEKEFWEGNVQKQVPPAPDGSERSGELVRALHPSGKGDGDLAPIYGLEDDIAMLMGIKDDIKALEREAEKYEQRIQMQIGDADGGKATGWTVWWRNQSRTGLDAARLKKEQPAVYEAYAKTTSYRRFTIEKEETDA